jgi:phage major head subunit gpT-like protein
MASAAPQIFATLKNGLVYWLGDKQFLQNVEHPIDAATQTYLENHAVDNITIIRAGAKTGQAEQKFAFRIAAAPVAAPAAAPAAAPK